MDLTAASEKLVVSTVLSVPVLSGFISVVFCVTISWPLVVRTMEMRSSLDVPVIVSKPAEERTADRRRRSSKRSISMGIPS